MKLYTAKHRNYCGIDLHAGTLYACIIDQEGTIVKKIFSIHSIQRRRFRSYPLPRFLALNNAPSVYFEV